ncbi:hypothetical protein [Pelagimonas varians]|uniref:Uncharacterized protein n=1 Tax=Pelagimonas varians TaxID=696760 RepID=A0A238L3Z8_9RHOB|nr:hypothetical protein [Pelagimonas varians]PYG26678.1 hypothetical protein C8N36_12021 [Pelagimonas varians]SMX49056.1 hypothetical protein PEV8663_04076 [Pelagimonas varians]
MPKRIQFKHIGWIAIGAGVTGVSIYLLMINVTLAHIEAVSGQIPFDMRPFGYAPADAAMMLDALGADGRKYYLSHQILLDTIYPAMLALTLIATICWFGQRMPKSKLVRAGIAASVGAALFDYVENLGIAAMILNWPDISAPLVFSASAATIVKSCLTTVAVSMAFLIGIIWTRLPKEDLGR